VREFLYRYEASWTCGADEWDEPLPARVRLYLHKYPIFKETEKGCWVNDWGDKHWVSDTTRKRFGHRTEEEAMEAYKQRKMAYVRHQKARLRRAERELDLAEHKTPSAHTGKLSTLSPTPSKSPRQNNTLTN
jgi:hypothetical protein